MLEQISEARRKEILALKAEVRRSCVDLSQLRHQLATPPLHGEVFCAKESSVLPPKMRAIVEDNRVLKERARKFRERYTDANEKVSKLSAEAAELRQQLRECQRQLAECDVQPADFAALKVQYIRRPSMEYSTERNVKHRINN